MGEMEHLLQIATFPGMRLQPGDYRRRDRRGSRSSRSRRHQVAAADVDEIFSDPEDSENEDADSRTAVVFAASAGADRSRRPRR